MRTTSVMSWESPRRSAGTITAQLRQPQGNEVDGLQTAPGDQESELGYSSDEFASEFEADTPAPAPRVSVPQPPHVPFSCRMSHPSVGGYHSSVAESSATDVGRDAGLVDGENLASRHVLTWC